MGLITLLTHRVGLVSSAAHACLKNLEFSFQSQKSYDEEDYDGSKRLGRKALHLGIISFVIGFVIITAYTVVHFTTV